MTYLTTTLKPESAFTLLEITIVLVVVGLIVGGILVGRDLLNAASVKAQISQIQSFQTAVNLFESKYDGLPGDLSVKLAKAAGFHVGHGCNGQQGGRDGNGLLDGYSPSTLLQGEGETAMFWQDLGSNAGGYATANLLNVTIPGASLAGFANTDNNYAFDCIGLFSSITTTSPNLNIGHVLPSAKIAQNDFIYVYENLKVNWYGLSAVSTILNNGGMYSSANIPVFLAYNIDSKIDDGLPLSGDVQANYVDHWAVKTAPNAASDSSATCYNTTSNTYSIGYNNGAGANCALSFQFLQ